jgi:nucleoside-diphosphate-sugar epimerase
MFDQPIFDKPNILVTGGAGFIGSHLCEQLLKRGGGSESGAKVICVDNFASSTAGNIHHLLGNPDFIFLKHDVTAPIDFASFPELERFKVAFQGIQEVYHLACPTSPKDFEHLRVATLLANAYGTVNALHVALTNKAKFLLGSSSVVYGDVPSSMTYVREDAYGVLNHLSPRASYDEGKRFAETCVATYRQQYDVQAKIARVFRTYGPRQRLRIGEMIPDFIVNALDGVPLTIFGDDSFTTSLIYVDDVVSGLMALMASDHLGPMNLGSPDEHRITDVAQQVLELTKSLSTIEFADPLLFMVSQRLPDIASARDALNWTPIIRLEDGLKKSIEYAEAHKGMLGYA